MKKYIFLLILALFSNQIVTAAQPLKDKFSAPVKWSSNGMMQTINVTNGSNKPIYVFIEASYTPAYGLTVTNCGTIREIKPGSAAVCTVEPAKAISFYAGGGEMHGTYQIQIVI